MGVRRLFGSVRPFATTIKINMPRVPETESFRFNHTMFRIKDPKVSIPFYTDIFGMELIDKHEASDFTLYFLAFDHGSGNETAEEKAANRFGREGILELTHNHGTESDSSFKGYCSGNEDDHK